MKTRQLLFIALLTPLPYAIADDVEVVKTELTKQGTTWQVSTTLRHDDTGWEH